MENINVHRFALSAIRGKLLKGKREREREKCGITKKCDITKIRLISRDLGKSKNKRSPLKFKDDLCDLK